MVGESGWRKKKKKKPLKQFIGLLSILVRQTSRVVAGESGWLKQKSKKKQEESKSRAKGDNQQGIAGPQYTHQTFVAATTTLTCRTTGCSDFHKAQNTLSRHTRLLFKDVRHSRATSVIKCVFWWIGVRRLRLLSQRSANSTFRQAH